MPDFCLLEYFLKDDRKIIRIEQLAEVFLLVAGQPFLGIFVFLDSECEIEKFFRIHMLQDQHSS